MVINLEVEGSISARFEQQVTRHASRVTLKTEAVTLTYERLNRAANRLAHALIDGVEPTPALHPQGRHRGSVALLFEQGADVITAFLGGLKAGLTVVPLDPAYPASRTAYMLEDSQAKTIVTDTVHVERAYELAQGRCAVVNLDCLSADWPESNPGLDIHPETFAYILYTSGSTGRPKGVIENHRNVLHFVRVFADSFPITPEDRLTLLTSCSFSASMADIFSSLLTGASLHLFDFKRHGVGPLAAWLQREAITIYHSVPTVYRHLVRSLHGHATFLALKLIYLAGEPIYRRDVDRYRQCFPPSCRFLSALGSTEMKIFQQFFIDHHTELPGDNVPVGYSVDDTAIVLLDEHGQIITGGGVGEIAVRSSYMCPGYWLQPDLTEATFAPDPEVPGARIYRTGDLGQVLPDGGLIHLGRKDAQVKVRGHRVELKEVETALLSTGLVDEAVIVLRQDASGDTALVAYVVPTRLHRPNATALRQHLQTALPAYMVPSRFIMLEAMPVTPTGKVDRQALPAPARSRPGLDVAYAAPRTRVESTLCPIWAEVLDLARRSDFMLRAELFALSADHHVLLLLLHHIAGDA